MTLENAPVLIRSWPESVLRMADADGDGLTVEGLVVPYGREIEAVEMTRDGVISYRERFEPGSNIRAVKAPNRVSLILGHEAGLGTLLGYGQAFAETSDGLEGRFRLHASRGDISRDVLTTSHRDFSVGFVSIMPRAGSERPGSLVVRRSVWLQHVAAVPEGQYAGAGVRSIREASVPDDGPQTPENPDEEDWLGWVDGLAASQASWRAVVEGSNLPTSDTPERPGTAEQEAATP